MKAAKSEALACQELVELVTDYLEQALTPDTSARFEQHLAECPWCLIYVQQICTVVGLAGHVATRQQPARATEALLAGVRARHRPA